MKTQTKSPLTLITQSYKYVIHLFDSHVKSENTGIETVENEFGELLFAISSNMLP